MRFYIDGYNLLFRLSDSKHTLQKQRHSIVQYLRKEFAHLKIGGLLVFDGAHRWGEESGRSYPSPLEIVYTPKGQSADQYIIEKLEHTQRPSSITVVTDDKHLSNLARSLKAKTQSNTHFIDWLQKKKEKKKEKAIIEAVDSKSNIERLLKIFEKRFFETEDPDP